MNQYQRDAVKTEMPDFKTVGYNGIGDRNLRTEHLTTGPYIHAVRKGHSLPTFEDLVRGLRRLPDGLDARGLTQCLSWYINMRDTFMPKLEMNVLHAQSLIRALRQPLKPFGPQNLDRNALEQWQTTGTVDSVEVEDNPYQPLPAMKSTRRMQLHLKLDKDEVSLNFTLPISRILTFPFLALHGVVEEAFKVGIDKAERRREETAKRAMEAEWVAKAAAWFPMVTAEVHNAPAQPTSKVFQDPYRIPKRPLPVETEQLAAQATVSRVMSPPRGPAAGRFRPIVPAPPRPTMSSHPQGLAYSSWTWNAPGPTLASAPQYQGQPDEYGRPVFHGGHVESRYAIDAIRQPESYLRSAGASGSSGQDSLDYMVDEYGNMIDLYGNVVPHW
jgi:hypothetical protein